MIGGNWLGGAADGRRRVVFQGAQQHDGDLARLDGPASHAGEDTFDKRLQLGFHLVNRAVSHACIIVQA